MNKFDGKKKDAIFHIIFAVSLIFLLLLPFVHINVRCIPYIFNDEFGYWASAAKFAGLDWSDTFSKIPYYSYGYGLILSILVRLFENMGTAYKVAIIFNGVWLALSYIFLYKSARIIFKSISKFIILIFSFVVVLFSSNIAEINYTWPEVFLFMLFTLCFYLIVLYIEHPNRSKAVLLTIIIVGTYYTHQRTLGICLAVIVLHFLLFLLKRITRKELLCFFLTLGICFIIGNIIKADIINSIWSTSDTVSSNNFSGQASKLATIFSAEGIIKLFFSFIGKIYYVFAATFLIVPFAIYTIFDKWIFSKKKLQFTNEFFIGIFLLLVFLFTIGINTIAMINPGNVTHIVYGRYIDNILGVYLLLGIIAIYKKCISLKQNIVLIILFFFISISVDNAVKYFQLKYRAAINSIGISYIVEQDYIEIWKGLIFVLGIWFFLQIIRKIFEKRRKVLVVVMSSCMILTFLVVGSNAYQTFELDWWDAARSSETCAKIIMDLEKKNNSSIEIYAIMEDSGYPLRYTGNGVQFLLKDTTVNSISILESKGIKWPDESIIIEATGRQTIQGFEIIYQDSTYQLSVPKNSQLYDLAMNNNF